MKKRLMSMLLAVVLTAGLTAVPVLADEPDDIPAEALKQGVMELTIDPAAVTGAGAEIVLEEVAEEAEEPAPELNGTGAAEEQPLNTLISIDGAEVHYVKSCYRIEVVNGTVYMNGKQTEQMPYEIGLKIDGQWVPIDAYDVTTQANGYMGMGSITCTGIESKGYTGTRTVTFRFSQIYTIAGSGNDGRYQTSARVTSHFYNSSSKFTEVVLVKGSDFPDALAANAYAGIMRAPLLLTRVNSVPNDVKTFLTTYQSKIQTVTFIGGGLEGAQAEVASLLPSATIQEIAGADRYETAEKLCERIIELRGTKATDGTVFVVFGRKAADALSASPWSYIYGYPILLTNSYGEATDKTKELIAQFSTVVVLGQEEQVKSSNVAQGITARLAGADRYATSRKVIEYFLPKYKEDFITSSTKMDYVVVASGISKNYPDALAGGQIMAPLLLVNDTESAIPSDLKQLLPTEAGKQVRFYCLGAAGKDQGTMYEKVAASIDK